MEPMVTAVTNLRERKSDCEPMQVVSLCISVGILQGKPCLPTGMLVGDWIKFDFSQTNKRRNFNFLIFLVRNKSWLTTASPVFILPFFIFRCLRNQIQDYFIEDSVCNLSRTFRGFKNTF